MSRSVVGVVLAAGQGTRMKSSLVKVMHEAAGRPMLDWVLEAVAGAQVKDVLVVVGYQHEIVAQHISGRATPVYQEQQLGTGHAVLQTRDRLEGTHSDVLIVTGDAPLLTANLLRELVDHHQSSGAAATILTARVDDPASYGRVVRSAQGDFERIIERADIEAEGPETPESARLEAIDEINSGVYCVKSENLFDALTRLGTDNAQGEYYLVDIFAKLGRQGLRVAAFEASEPQLVMGVNDRAALARAARVLRGRINERHMLDGVSIVDPATTFIDEGVEIAPDTTIHPFTTLRGHTRIASSCEIGPGADIVNSTIGPGTTVVRSTIEDSQVGARVKVGPYSHIRPGCSVSDGVRIGNYAELKNSTIGAGSKVSHHSYVGDTDMGERVNMGAGVVTVNYDGYEKHRTVIEPEAFVGCNVNLIAPVRVGKGAYVAAGSTITRDVPPMALGVGRSRQRNIEGWVERWRSRHGDN